MADDVDRVKQIAFSSMKSIRINIHLPVQTGDRVKRLVTLRFWSLSIFARFPWRIHQILKSFFRIPAQLTLPCLTSLFSARVREQCTSASLPSNLILLIVQTSGVVDYKVPLQMSIHLATGDDRFPKQCRYCGCSLVSAIGVPQECRVQHRTSWSVLLQFNQFRDDSSACRQWE